MKRGDWLGIAAVALVSAAIWLSGNSYAQDLLVGILTWTIVGQSWSFLADKGGMWSLGHNAFLGIGAYVMAYTALAHLSFPAGLLLVLGAGALGGLVLGILTCRLQTHYLSLVTFMFAIGLGVIATHIYGSYGLIVPTDVAHRMLSEPLRIVVLIALAVLVMAALAVLRDSAFGLRLKAVRDDQRAAAAVGISVAGMRIRAFVVSACVASLAGPVFVLHYGLVGPETAFGISTSLNPILFSVAGGVSHLLGPFLGALVLLPLSSAVAEAWSRLPGLSGMLYYGILLVGVALLPNGIVGAAAQVRRLGKFGRAPRVARPWPQEGADRG